MKNNRPSIDDSPGALWLGIYAAAMAAKGRARPVSRRPVQAGRGAIFALPLEEAVGRFPGLEKAAAR